MRTDPVWTSEMRRLPVLTVALLLVGVAVAVPASGVGTTAAEGTPAATSTPAAPLQQTGATDGNETDANETGNGSVAPGARLAGVLGVQGSEVSGEIESRALEERLDAAQSDRAKARVVATQYDESRERLRQLRERRRQLTEAYENGSIRTGAYHARLAQVTAEIRSLERLTNRTERSAATLPAETLDRQGVNVSAIRALGRDVRNASGPEAAAAARSIAGDRVGRGMARVATNDSAGPGRSGDAPGRSGDSGRSDAPGRSGESGQSNVSEAVETDRENANESGNGPSVPVGADDRNESDGRAPSSETAGAPAGNQTGDPASNETAGTGASGSAQSDDESDSASLPGWVSTLFG